MSESVSRAARSRPKAERWARRRASQVMDAGLRAFYAADPRRGPSRERAAWIADTEELYTVRHSGDTADAEVTVLARVGADALDRALAGWRRICEGGQPGSYEWLVERARGAWRAAAPAF
jgi:hypothetical protein